MLRALAFCILVAGCAGPSAPVPEGGATERAPEAIAEFDLRVDIAAGSGATPVPVSVTVPAQNGGPINVPPGTTVVLIEARWTCSTPTCTFRVELQDPQDRPFSTTYSDGDFRAELADAPAGKWDLGLKGEGSAQMVGKVRATAFFGPMPAGYSAFESSPRFPSHWPNFPCCQA